MYFYHLFTYQQTHSNLEFQIMRNWTTRGTRTFNQQITSNSESNSPFTYKCMSTKNWAQSPVTISSSLHVHSSYSTYTMFYPLLNESCKVEYRQKSILLCTFVIHLFTLSTIKFYINFVSRFLKYSPVTMIPIGI